MQTLVEFIKFIFPVKIEAEAGAAVVIIGTIFVYFTGTFDKLIETLLIFMMLDYVSGIIAAYENPDKKLSPVQGAKGILKKIMILLVVATAHFIDYAIGQTIVRSTIILFFIGNEGLSIIENAAAAGLPIPDKLKSSLKELMQEQKERK